MSARNLLLSLILVIFASAMVLADGGFYGRIIYKNCECNSLPYDYVKIDPEESGEPYLCYVQCHSGYAHYHTRVCGPPHVFPPGWYVLGVQLSDSSNCYYGVRVRVYHGEDWQEVNLEVRGPEITPWGGDE